MSTLNESNNMLSENINRNQNTGNTQPIFQINNDNYQQHKQSHYSVIGTSDIQNFFLRAAFEGDVSTLMRSTDKKEKQNVEDTWNLYLLAFFLAVQNVQLKTANKIYMNSNLMNIVQRAQEKKIVNEILLSSDASHEKVQFNKYKPRIEIDEVQSMVRVGGGGSVESSLDYDKRNYDLGMHAKTVKEKIKTKEESFESNFSHKKQSKTENFTKQNKNFFGGENDLIFIKQVLKSDFCKRFNSNILRIALNMNEDRIAAFIVARLPCYIDEETINYAVSHKCLIFLYFDMDEEEENEDDFRLTIEKLIIKVNNYFDFHTGEEILNTILNWKFETQDNILKILCEIGYERIAAKFMNEYLQFSSWDFFFFCVINEKQHFLKHALRNQYFEEDFISKDQLINYILADLLRGVKINFNLNILLYTDFKKWNLVQLHDFTLVAKSFLATNLETSYVLITYNSILAISLMIQFLKQIKYHFNILDVECIKLINKFQILGKLIIENLSFDDIEAVFMEKDFTDRPVLQIITSNEIMSFIVKNKLKYLLDKIWEGKYYSMVDGKISHFSQTQYLLNHSIKKYQGASIEFKDIIVSNFKANCDNYNFIYQMIFRQESIKLILIRDFISATLMVLVFQYINYLYLNLFTRRRYEDEPSYDRQVEIIQNNIKEYKQINFYGTILSVSYLLSLVQRIIYNSFAKKKLEFDLWLAIDLFAGVANLVAFNIIGNASPSQMMDENQKRSLDYFMILVLVVSWLRYFSYFMILDSIAKVTLTLFRMLKETLSFFIILSTYLILMATIFATLFRDANTPDAQCYTNLLTTLRQMIDFFIGNYSDKDMGNYNTSHSILVVIHVVISYIFFMNYLIAILSTVYDIMIKNGDFYSTQYSYIFVSKYIKALSESNGYEKLILYSPPLNFLLIPLVIASPNRSLTKAVSRYLGFIFFWIENIFILIAFLLYMIFIDFVVFVKICYQITNINGNSSKLFYITFWVLFGNIYLLCINILDTCTLFNILCFEKSISFENEEDEKRNIKRHKFYIYRDCIRAIKQLKEIAESTTVVFNQKQQLIKALTSKMSLRKKLENQDIQQSVEDTFIIEKELIVSTYAQIASQNKYTQQYRTQYYIFLKQKSSQSLYSTIETGIITQRDQIFSEPVLNQEFKNFVSQIMLTNRKDPSALDITSSIKSRSNQNHMTRDEEKLVRQFLQRFEHFNKGQQNSSINLALVNKAFPLIFTPQEVDKVELMNFQKMQKVLIKFYNDDKDEMFNYYDNRMKSRFKSLKQNQDVNNKIVNALKQISIFICDYIDRDIQFKQSGKYQSSNGGHPDIYRNFSFFNQNSNSNQNIPVKVVPTMQSKNGKVPDTLYTELDSIREERLSQNQLSQSFNATVTNPQEKRQNTTIQLNKKDQQQQQQHQQQTLVLDQIFNPFQGQQNNNNNNNFEDNTQLSQKTGTGSLHNSYSLGERIFAEAEQKIKEDVNAMGQKAKESRERKKEHRKTSNDPSSRLQPPPLNIINNRKKSNESHQRR